MTSLLAVLVLSAFVSLAPLWNFSKGTQIEIGEGAGGESDTSDSLICNSNQAMYRTNPLHYQHAPCWEIYLRTVIFSAKQPSTRTRRWLILSRHRMVYHCLVTEICYSESLLHHRSGQSCAELTKCRMANNLACASRGCRQCYIRWHAVYVLFFFSSKCIWSSC